MKKIFLLITILCAFVLVGCNKKKKNDFNLSEEEEFYILADDFIIAFSGGNARGNYFSYYEDNTFTEDSSDSNYEIGYMFDIDLKFELRIIDDYEPGIVLRGKYALTHHKVRRNKSTKELDSSYKPYFLDDSGETYQIYTEYSEKDGSKVVKETCKTTTTETNKYKTFLSEEEFMNIIPCTIYEVPFEKMSRALDTENTSSIEKYIYTYDVTNLNKKITFKGDEVPINGSCSMVVVMKDGREIPVISFSKTIKFDYV